MVEFVPLLMFLAVCLLLMFGYPVAFTLAGTALAFAAGGILTGTFDAGFLSALPGRAQLRLALLVQVPPDDDQNDKEVKGNLAAHA